MRRGERPGVRTEAWASRSRRRKKRLPPLPAAVEVACYRIAQEAITNVARHAGAASCRVRLSVDEGGDELRIEVTDDGVGIPKERRDRGGPLLDARARRRARRGRWTSRRPPKAARASTSGCRSSTRKRRRSGGVRAEARSRRPSACLIADDHTLFRYGDARPCSPRRTGYEVAGEAADWRRGRRQGRRAVAGRGPDGHPDAGHKRHRGHAPDERRLARTSGSWWSPCSRTNDSVFAAMRAGARGYVLKGADGEEVIKVVGAVAGGEAHFGPEIARRLMGFFSATRPALRRRPSPSSPPGSARSWTSSPRGIEQHRDRPPPLREREDRAGTTSPTSS